MRKGGDNQSTQSTNTTTNVTDRRFVNDGGGAGVAGDNNTTWNSISTTNISTDLGAIAGAMDLAKTGIQTSHDNLTAAVGLAGQTFEKSVDANTSMFNTNASNMMDGFNKLIDASNAVIKTAQDVNTAATQDVQQAYANAQAMGNGQRFLVAGGLVIAGIVAVEAMKGRL